MNDKGWEVTFSDMLTLLLTFFVFIISISTFKTEEYKRFWNSFEISRIAKQSSSSSKGIELIKGLKLPVLPIDAENMIDEITDLFMNSDYKGVRLNYTENKISLSISDKLVFDINSINLTKEGQNLLKDFVRILNKSDYIISIEGHTDSTKSKRISNIELSLQRALSVARFLILNGLDKNKVQVSGYGEYRPIADNSTPEGRQLNRRVEINILINH